MNIIEKYENIMKNLDIPQVEYSQNPTDNLYFYKNSLFGSKAGYSFIIHELKTNCDTNYLDDYIKKLGLFLIKKYSLLNIGINLFLHHRNSIPISHNIINGKVNLIGGNAILVQTIGILNVDESILNTKRTWVLFGKTSKYYKNLRNKMV